MPPSQAEIISGWAAACNLLEQTRLYGNKNATNFVGLLDTFTQALENEWADEAAQSAQSMRSLLAGMVSDAIARDVQRPFLRQFCRTVVGRTDLVSDAQMLAEAWLYMQVNNVFAGSANFTFGTPATSGTFIGNGQMLRLTRDRYNFPMENQHVDSKRARCIRDRNTGTNLGNETFFLEGQAGARDGLQISGSGAGVIVTGATADDSLLSNASFDNTDSASAPTEITDWTASATINSTNFDFDATNYFRAAPSASTSYALNVKASTTLTQKRSVKNATFSQDIPYMLCVMFNAAVGSAVGTLTARMGAVATSVATSGLAGWRALLVPTSTGQSCWYRQFQQEDLQIQLQWARTSGNLLIDDVLWIPGTYFDGSYYWLMPATATAYIPFRVNDTYTFADSAPYTNAVFNRWAQRAWRWYWPSSNGSSITLL